MRGKLNCWICLAILTVPILAQGLHYGQNKESVVLEIGEPNGKRQLSGGELWVYSGDIALTFENGLLVRAKGTDLIPKPAPAPTPEPAQEAPAPSTINAQQSLEGDPTGVAKAAVEQPAKASSGQSEDDELLEVADSISNPDAYREAVESIEEDFSPQSTSETILQTVLGIVIPTLLQWIFLLIAFKWLGAEAMKSVLFLIALVDRFVILGVEWVFLDFLDYPMTFHADSLLSFIVMLGLVSSFTHAKQLPTAIKVVVASKVAGFVAGYLFLLFILHYL